MINEHKSVYNGIYKLNLMLRRPAGLMSIVVKIDRIILLFILINFNNNILVDIFVSGAFCILYL